ncbi:MAG: F0F1 ATP synthase subunit B [Thermoanaerobaculia bacterium]|nr:F0F1 ATP synthase subunit B [Thermoanaerobaculia bacterium]MCZ7652786.1 F0F1 ATP synthase subunit B [Thermoanaerobaculia bacterium]
MRSHLLSIAASALLLAAPLAAAEGGGASPFSGDVGNAIWTLVIFLLVVLFLGKFAWGPLLKGLQSREEFIRSSLETAKRDREAAEARLQEYEAKLAAARTEAAGIVEEARRAGETLRRRLQDEAQAESRQTVERARRDISLATETAKRELHDYAGELAVAIAERVLGREIDRADHERLVAESIEEISRSGN